jgi:hypothetical protein
MKYSQIFALMIVAAILDHANSFFLGGGSGQGKLSFNGNFHGLLGNHPWFRRNQQQQSQDESPAPPPDPETETSSGGFDFGQIIGYVKRTVIYLKVSDSNENFFIRNVIQGKVKFLQSVQRGLSSRIDNHIERLQRFETRVMGHFNKGSSPASIDGDIDLDFDTVNEGDSVSSGFK